MRGDGPYIKKNEEIDSEILSRAYNRRNVNLHWDLGQSESINKENPLEYYLVRRQIVIYGGEMTLTNPFTVSCGNTCFPRILIRISVISLRQWRNGPISRRGPIPCTDKFEIQTSSVVPSWRSLRSTLWVVGNNMTIHLR